MTDEVDAQWAAARASYETALTEFQAATQIVIDRVKTREPIEDVDWQREADARARLLAARDLVSRLSRLRKLAEGI